MKQSEIKKFALTLKRKAESHKYDYGHILVIAGSRNMPGAGVLCCNAVMRSGAGLVTYAVKEDFFNIACAMSKPETIFFEYKNANDILKYIKDRKVSAVIIGPGLEEGKQQRHSDPSPYPLPQGARSKKTIRGFITRIISGVDVPVVLDASGLVSFAGNVEALKKVKAKLIITPHEGEFSKLIGQDIKTIKDKSKLILNFAKENSLICVLKKHKTLVSDGKSLYINDSGTPAMATAGSGDVLSGVIAAFAAISDNLFESVKFAVFVHGRAGEISQKEKGNGVIASDIIDNITKSLISIK